jgi:nucleoside-diphosphate-sugar epimerase
VKRAIVTGASGLIGRHITARLTTDGWDVLPLDLKTTPPSDAKVFFRIDNSPWDLVVHCAAHIGGRLDIEGRPTYLAAVNLQLDAALFEWALRTRPAHIIYWSSSAAYPTSLQGQHGAPGPLREWDINHHRPELPDQSYGMVKIVGEQLALSAQNEGLKVHVFRPFSGWAADQSTDYPMGAFLDRARRRADPFEIWGTGEQVRDWIHVDDVISAALAAVEQDYPGPLNLCTGIPTSFNRLAVLVTTSAGYSPVLLHRPEKPTGVHYRVGDPTEMMKVYTPKTTLTQGVLASLGAT